MTGYSRQQLTRLLQRWRESGRLEQRYVAPTAGFRRRYAAQDVQLLAEIDALHGTLFGPATCVLLRRAFTGYGEARYARVAPHWFERESNYGRVSPISVHYRPRLIRCWRKSNDCCARWTRR